MLLFLFLHIYIQLHNYIILLQFKLSNTLNMPASINATIEKHVKEIFNWIILFTLLELE